MAEEQGKGIQQIEGCEVIYDMGSGLVLAKVPLRFSRRKAGNHQRPPQSKERKSCRDEGDHRYC